VDSTGSIRFNYGANYSAGPLLKIQRDGLQKRIFVHGGSRALWIPSGDRADGGRAKDVICLDNYFTGRRPTSPAGSATPTSSFGSSRRDERFRWRNAIGSGIWHCPASPVHYHCTIESDGQNQLLGTYKTCWACARRVRGPPC